MSILGTHESLGTVETEHSLHGVKSSWQYFFWCTEQRNGVEYETFSQLIKKRFDLWCCEIFNLFKKRKEFFPNRYFTATQIFKKQNYMTTLDSHTGTKRNNMWLNQVYSRDLDINNVEGMKYPKLYIE